MKKTVTLAAVGLSLLVTGCASHKATQIREDMLALKTDIETPVSVAPQPWGGLQPGVRLMVGDEPIAGQIGHMVPCVTDWNMDGKKDLIVGEFSGGKIQLLLNEGTDAAPVFNKMSLLEAGGKQISLPAG